MQPYRCVRTILIFLRWQTGTEISSTPTVQVPGTCTVYIIDNYDTIVSKNVIIDYTDNKITSEVLDFSLIKNLMIISENVVYSNSENIMKADTIEVDITTKDTKIYMYENKKKVNEPGHHFQTHHTF